jgi:enhancer of mRNA-decapping protein 4
LVALHIAKAVIMSGYFQISFSYEHDRGCLISCPFWFQVDLQGFCRAIPMRLNQGVFLALFQQLACDIANDTSRKLQWMTHVAVAINPTDPIIAMHVRSIFDQVYGVLAHQPTTSALDAKNIRLILHVITSVLMNHK